MDSVFLFPGPPSLFLLGRAGRTGFILTKPDPQQHGTGSRHPGLEFSRRDGSLPGLLKRSGGGSPCRENVPV